MKFKSTEIKDSCDVLKDNGALYFFDKWCLSCLPHWIMHTHILLYKQLLYRASDLPDVCVLAQTPTSPHPFYLIGVQIQRETLVSLN